LPTQREKSEKAGGVIKMKMADHHRIYLLDTKFEFRQLFSYAVPGVNQNFGAVVTQKTRWL
jgi:hypothetical protein